MMVPRPVPESQTHPLIPEYFAGREVFITGGTGFMGKVLVERLLWTCPDISRLHLLMRHKKEAEPEKRLVQLKQSQVFDVIRQHCPQQLEKLSIVAGDVTKQRFGFDHHCISQLNQVLIHVSTAYTNAELTTIEERVYDAPAQLHHVLTLIEALPTDMLAEITPKLISPKPNTYTFTKAMAESAVAERAAAASYATAIFRPTIVTSSLHNPFPGWIENLNGPSGALVGAGKGMLHVLSCSANSRADMIPVDICIDTLIAVAWETAMDNTREARVYNCSSWCCPTTWGQFRDHVISSVRAYPFDNVLLYPFGILSENALISPKPNTYTFTKAMAESAVAERAAAASYATAIFRPTIVTSSLHNPFPGWIENLNGPSGALVGAGKGMLHVLSCSANSRADMIPVDICIDTLIAVAWETAMDKLISPKPNTYTFTKAMAESAVAERAAAASFATAIFRPTIVTSSLHNPFPGWIENLNGPSGALVGAGKGMLHVLSCSANSRADMIPVDICIDTLIAVAWETAMDNTREARVYNCSSWCCPTTWGQFRDHVISSVRAYPFDNVLLYPFGILSENAVMQKFLATTLHTVPLNLIHYVFKICGFKTRPSLSTVSKRLHAMDKALRFFGLREWHFSTENVRRLRERLSAPDAAVYNLDPTTINWEDHCVDFVKGARKYLLREKDQDIEKAQRRMHMLHIIHNGIKLFLTVLLCRLAIRTAPAILRAVAILTRLRKNGAMFRT